MGREELVRVASMTQPGGVPGLGTARRGRGRRAAVVAMIGVLVIALSACMSNPPPPEQETAPPPTPTEYPDEKTINIATDSIGAGFNPHIAADQSAATTAIAAMTLPSVFAPVQVGAAPNDQGVRWELQEDFVTSAEVTSEAPFTVTYRIHTNAQWSDGLPVTGDDFAYLWQQLSRQPNVVAPAGYRLINAVDTTGGGKTVTVRFAERYPAWRELFTNLLPSHVLRGAPAGFQTSMDSGKPVSAGPYSIFSIDTTRDEIRLVRNDRYWMTPPQLDQVVLRRAGTPSQMVDTIRTGDSSIAVLGAGPATSAELNAVPGIRSERSAAARSLGVHINTRTEAMGDIEVRRALLGIIDPELASYAGAGDAIVDRFANTIYAPSDAEYFPVDRERIGAERAVAALEAAGYLPDDTGTGDTGTGDTGTDDTGTGASGTDNAGETTPTTTAPQSSPEEAPAGAPEAEATGIPELPESITPLRRDGGELIVRIGAIGDDARSVSTASTISDQLRSQGIRAGVVRLPSNELYGAALTDEKVDMVVGWSGVGAPPAANFASQVDCDEPKPETAPGADATPSPSPGQSEEGVETGSYAGNIAGLCNPRLIELAREALLAEDPTPLLAQAEPLLADEAIYLPLYQDSLLVGTTGNVADVDLSGPIQVSIFGGATRWDLP